MRYNAAFEGTSDEAIQRIFSLWPSVTTVLDPTYGRGVFYKLTPQLQVTGGDIDPVKAKDYVGDYRALPFGDRTFDAVVLDPPFLTGSRVKSAYHEQYSVPQNVLRKTTMAEMLGNYEMGIDEAFRVAKKLVVVKCADGVDSGKFLPFAWTLMNNRPPVWDIVIMSRSNTMTHPSWKTVQHFRHNYSYFLVWRIDEKH